LEKSNRLRKVLFLAIQKTPDVVRRSLGLRQNRKMVSAYRAKNKSV